MTPLAVERRPEGIYVPALELFLDPVAPVARAFLSHAHADHAGGAESGVVFASPETIALVGARRDPAAAASLVARARALAPGDTLDERGAKLSLAPAGHVLGASQLVIEHAGGRFVYTGDVSLGEAATHRPGAAVACDELLIESTFGVPIFQWPDRDEELARLVAFCKDAVSSGKRALVLAYALGKGQELTAALLGAGLDPVLHGAVMRVARAYEALGVPLGIAEGRTRAYADVVSDEKRAKSKSAPPVVVAPPWAAKALSKGAAVAYCSGFALIDAHVDRYRADAGFVLSDHASWDELCALAKASGARQVHTTHGQAEELARALALRGMSARALGGDAIDDDGRAEEP